MNVGELKAKLVNFPDDMEVRVYADHGQYAMAPYKVSEVVIEDEYMAEVLDKDDEGLNVVLIEG